MPEQYRRRLSYEQLAACPERRNAIQAALQRYTVEEGDCLIWTGYTGAYGVPAINIGGHPRPVRRLLLALEGRGTDEPQQLAINSCRTPGCVRAEHVRLIKRSAWSRLLAQEGTYSRPDANAMRTAAARARANLKLTPELAREIRQSDAPGAELAQRYGVHPSMIARIRRGEAWADAAANASVFTWRGLA